MYLVYVQFYKVYSKDLMTNCRKRGEAELYTRQIDEENSKNLDDNRSYFYSKFNMDGRR